MFVLPLILFIAWPVAELYVIVKVAEAIGVLEAIALLIVAWPLGTWAMRSQGRAVWRRMRTAVDEGRPPAREVLDGTLILFGGALLIIPGFITDVLGLALLFPPTRALVRAVLVRNIENRLVIRAFAVTRPRDPHDVDSTATDIDQPRLQP